MNAPLPRPLPFATRRNALVTPAEKARWFRDRMRYHALEWKTWRNVPGYHEAALQRATGLRDVALYHEAQSLK